jgi:hypothetical protein
MRAPHATALENCAAKEHNARYRMSSDGMPASIR